MTTLIVFLDMIINSGGFTPKDLCCLCTIIITFFFSVAQADENYVEVDGKVRKVVYCEAERINKVLDDDVREAMTWESYWNFSDDA
jgi:hypothetical protein